MQSERKIHADINQARDGWIQVTLSGEGAAELTEAQIEAALSAAEPVEWQRKNDAFGWQRVTVDDLEYYREKNAELRALYAAPPAPSSAPPQCCMCGKNGLSTTEGDGGTECELSDGRWVCSAECWDRAVEPAPSVAVKALADAYKAGFDASSQGYNGEVFPEYEADNEWLAQRDSDLSALSAQVQDVAGWQTMDTAPKDGTTFLAIMAKAYSPRATLCKVEDGKFFSPSQGEKFVVPGWNQWWPTHWMPLPAAPAKQEGGE